MAVHREGLHNTGTHLFDEAAQQRRQRLDGLLLSLFFYLTKEILNEYHENYTNANIDCSVYLNLKEKAQKQESTTHCSRVEQSCHS